MKNSFANLCILMLFVTTIISCSIEKRKYMDGYHVEWMHKNRTIEHSLISDVPKDSLNSNPIISQVPNEDAAVVSIPKQFNQADSIPKSNLKNGDARPQTNSTQKHHLLAEVFSKNIISRIDPTGNFPGQKLDIDSSGKNITAMIAFVFSVLAIVSLLIALIFAEGWAALGYIALMALFTVVAGLFSLISLALFIHAHERLPWYEWVSLVVCLFGIFIALRIWVFKG